MPCFHKDVGPSAEQSDKYSLGKDSCLKSQTLPKLVNFAVAKCLYLVSSTLFAILPYKSINAKLCSKLL